MPHTVIIGGGQAGASLAAKLRSLAPDEAITLLCGEPEPPYQRPPLSKGYLLGEIDKPRLYLRPETFYDEAGIELRLGARVRTVDPAAQTVALDGETLRYDRLALTTGSLPRRLPAEIGGALEGVHTVRTIADVDAMAPAFRPGSRLVVVGGGYIGLEAAAVAAKKGLQVTVVEMAERILQRVAAPETADYVRALHRGHGVDIREGVGLARLLGSDRVSGAELTDGSELPADFVVVGVGIVPDTALAAEAALTLDNGIAADATCQTSDRAIWAAGDCASFPWRGRRIRLESVQNAIDQAECAAANMAGQRTEYDPTPWFWSDQFDMKLQIAGLNHGYDRTVVRRDAPEGPLSVWYYRGDELIAVDAMTAPRAYMIGKRLLEAGISPPPEAIADPATDLKALLRG